MDGVILVKKVVLLDSIEVPAGKFKTLDRLSTYIFFDREPRYSHIYYAEGTDPIMKSKIYASPLLEHHYKLLRYHVEEE